MLAFCIGYFFLVYRIPLLPFQANQAFTARTMPQALSILGIVLSLLLIVKPSSDARPQVEGFHWLQGVLICVTMVAYGLTVRPMGFLITTTLFLIAGFTILGERRWWIILFASVPIVVFFWVLMAQVLGVYVAPWPEFFES